jgi:hypothetical protein
LHQVNKHSFAIGRPKSSYYSFETWPGGLTRDSADPRLEPGRIEEKIGEGKTRCDPVTRLTRQDPVKNPVAIRWFFLLKRRHFDLKKFDPDNPVTRKKPGTQVLDRAGHRAGYENHASDVSYSIILSAARAFAGITVVCQL